MNSTLLDDVQKRAYIFAYFMNNQKHKDQWFGKDEVRLTDTLQQIEGERLHAMYIAAQLKRLEEGLPLNGAHEGKV